MNPWLNRTAITLALLMVWAAPVRAQQPVAQAAPFDGLTAWVEDAIRAWEIPGLALAIVRGDSIVYARGFGVRELQRPERVDDLTVFAIGSNTKAFTAAAVGMLVDEARMQFDGPLIDYLPGFRVADAYVTRHLTVRDALSHRTGLGRGDMVWYGSGIDRAEVMRRMRHLPMDTGFRSSFGYNNLAYLAVGEAAAAAAGAASWDDLIERRIFTPLGMHASGTAARSLTHGDNIAAPHMRVDGAMQKVPVRNIDNVAPAGSINSNVRDMAQWIRLNLADGTYDGTRLLSETTLRTLHSPQMLTPPVPTEAAPMRFSAYGLGWVIQDYAGSTMVWHNGGIDGMLSEVRLIPEHDVGWVILTNSMSHNFMPALSYRIADLVLARPAREWSAEFLGAAAAQDARLAEIRAQRDANRLSDTRPSLALDAYAGVYENALFGDAELVFEGGTLAFRHGTSFRGRLVHWQHDTFRVDWQDAAMGDALVTFRLDSRSRPAEVVVSGLGTFERR